jgi:hypothetical protein
MFREYGASGAFVQFLCVSVFSFPAVSTHSLPSFAFRVVWYVVDELLLWPLWLYLLLVLIL